MKLNLYKDLQKFHDDHINLLLEKEWLNNLIISNILYGLKNTYDDWLFGNLTVNNNIELIFLQRKPWKLLLYSLINEDLDNKLNYFVKEIYKIDKNINGVNSTEDIAQKFSNFYCSLSNKNPKIKIKMRILLLKQMKQGTLNKGLIFRNAELKDKNILKKFIYDFSYEIHHTKLNDEKIENLYNKYLDFGYYIIENDGKIVSQAAVVRKLINGKCLGAVYTPKEERNNGYCYNLIYRLCDELLKQKENKFICLYTEDYNEISNHIYMKKLDLKDNIIVLNLIFYK